MITSSVYSAGRPPQADPAPGRRILPTTRVQLPSGSGAWPALCTWQNGGSEIDSFEYHPDNPNLLELTNHVKSGSDYFTDASAVAPGRWVTIGT